MSSSMAQLQLPIAAYELTDQQSAEEDYLGLRLTQVCMSRAGFKFLPGLSAGYIADDVRIQREFESRRYGVSDLTVVTRYGYHLPGWITGPGTPDSLASLPRAEQAALAGTDPADRSSGAAASGHGRTGPPAGGCLDWSNNELAAAGISPGSGASEVVAQIRQESFVKAQSDPRVRAVFAAWSACMRSHGYHYSSPFTAAADSRWTTASSASPAEITTAETDVACKSRANVLGVEFAVESDYENAAIANNNNTAALAQAKAAANIQGRSLNRLMAKYGD